MKKVSVLGAGLVGKAIAVDLNQKFNVTSFDIMDENLNFLSENYKINTQKADLSDKNEITAAVKNADIVVCAVPGFMGFETLKQIILNGKDVVDISFFPEDAFELDELAKEKNVTAIVDCGVAPGMGNIICGYHNQRMQMTDYQCYVGGLPVIREWPFDYKAVFSPIDVIEEYTRPARYIQNNELIIKEALSDTELMYFDNVGTLEAFNSDGLRTLMKTMKIPNMIEKTLRYPGTVEYMKVLRACGFFDKTKIDVNGQKVSPLDLTANLLFPKWKLKEGEKEFTVMKIICEGIENGEKVKHTYDLFDTFDDKTKMTSMARTTGYTCTAAVNLIAENIYQEKGISPPEYIALSDDKFQFIIDYLSKRNILYKHQKVIIN